MPKVVRKQSQIQNLQFSWLRNGYIRKKGYVHIFQPKSICQIRLINNLLLSRQHYNQLSLAMKKKNWSLMQMYTYILSPSHHASWWNARSPDRQYTNNNNTCLCLTCLPLRNIRILTIVPAHKSKNFHQPWCRRQNILRWNKSFSKNMSYIKSPVITPSKLA